MKTVNASVSVNSGSLFYCVEHKNTPHSAVSNLTSVAALWGVYQFFCIQEVLGIYRSSQTIKAAMSAGDTPEMRLA